MCCQRQKAASSLPPSPHINVKKQRSIPGAERPLNTIDFGLTVFFAAYWLLRFFLAERRARFAFSWPSLVDALTILPVFWSYIVSRAGVDAPTLFFLRILRILRVLRLFNMAQAARRVESAVTRAGLNLGLTMLSMMVISAGARHSGWGAEEEEWRRGGGFRGFQRAVFLHFSPPRVWLGGRRRRRRARCTAHQHTNTNNTNNITTTTTAANAP